MLIDHLIYRAPDLASAVADLEERSGVRAQAGGQHIGRGTHNALLALGPRTYLEIIAPDPGQPAPSVPRPFGLDGGSRAGLVGWAIACRDIDAAVARACSRGYDSGEVAGMQRATPGGGAAVAADAGRGGRWPGAILDQLGRYRAPGEVSTARAHLGIFPPRAPPSGVLGADAHGSWR
jgi:hypothetical protein